MRDGRRSPTRSLAFRRTVVRDDVWEERHLARSLDRDRNEALVSAART
jgi:hypothetical protein